MFEVNNFELSYKPNFFVYEEEKDGEISVRASKRKYEDIDYDVQREWEKLEKEFHCTEKYFEKLSRKKFRLLLE